MRHRTDRNTPPRRPPAPIATGRTLRAANVADGDDAHDSFGILDLAGSIVPGAGAGGRRSLQAYAIADGRGGDEASRLAVDHALRSVVPPPELGGVSPPESQDARLERVPEEIRRLVRSRAGEDPSRRGLVTTLTLAYVDWPRLLVVHVGDGRCYRHGRRGLELLTSDHTLQAMLEDGYVAAPGPDRDDEASVVWNAIAADVPLARTDVRAFRLDAGDTLLLCTDGLHREVSEERIATVLERARSPRLACDELLDAAGASSTDGDATALVIRFPEPPSRRPWRRRAQACRRIGGRLVRGAAGPVRRRPDVA